MDIVAIWQHLLQGFVNIRQRHFPHFPCHRKQVFILLIWLYVYVRFSYNWPNQYKDSGNLQHTMRFSSIRSIEASIIDFWQHILDSSMPHSPLYRVGRFGWNKSQKFGLSCKFDLRTYWGLPRKIIKVRKLA